MLISIIYIIQDATDFITELPQIKKNVAGIDYHAGHFELLFMVNSRGNGFKKVDGPPMARVFYLSGNERNLIAKGVFEARGDVIIVGSQAMRFERGDLKVVLEQKKTRRDFNGWSIFKKQDMPELPKDLFCFRTYFCINSILNNFNLNCNFSRFNRQEILRFAYLHKRLTFKQKVWIAWKYLRGVN